MEKPINPWMIWGEKNPLFSETSKSSAMRRPGVEKQGLCASDVGALHVWREPLTSFHHGRWEEKNWTF